MQDLENYSQADAQRILESMVGVNFTFETIASEKSAGTVIRTEPAAGAQINAGDTITVYVSDGSQMNVVETVDEEVVRQEEEENRGGNFFDNLFDNLRPGNDEDKNNESAMSQGQGISEWNTDSSENSSTEGTTVPESESIVFELTKYHLTIKRTEGISAISPDPMFLDPTGIEPGTQVTVYATVEEGYTFKNWISNNSTVAGSSSAQYTFVMPKSDVTLTACAKIAPDNGKCGDNTYWTFDGTHLKITGNGPMNYQGSTPPWVTYSKKILSLSIANGITSIGDNAFRNCTRLSGNIYLPESINHIGKFAFADCTSINSISIPSGIPIEQISGFAFNGWTNSQTIYFRDRSQPPGFAVAVPGPKIIWNA